MINTVFLVGGCCLVLLLNALHGVCFSEYFSCVP